MDSTSDSVCSSVVSSTPLGITQEDRHAAVNSLNMALSTRGIALGEFQKLWMASDFEADLRRNSAGIPTRYQALLKEKLCEICSSREGSSEADGCGDVRVCENGVEGSKKDSPTGAVSGQEILFGIEDSVWDKIHNMQDCYFIALQSCYVALVAALRQRTDLPKREEQSLKAYKRLTLGLVMFLSAPRQRIPRRFNVEKLTRLEAEILQIFACMLHKVASGTMHLAAEITKKMESLILDAPAVLQPQKRPRNGCQQPGDSDARPARSAVAVREAVPVLLDVHCNEESSADSAYVADQSNDLSQGNRLTGLSAENSAGQDSFLGKHGRNGGDAQKGSVAQSHLGQLEKRARTNKPVAASWVASPGRSHMLGMNQEVVNDEVVYHEVVEDSECSVA